MGGSTVVRAATECAPVDRGWRPAIGAPVRDMVDRRCCGADSTRCPGRRDVKPLVAGSGVTSTWGSSAGHDDGIEPTRGQRHHPDPQSSGRAGRHPSIHPGAARRRTRDRRRRRRLERRNVRVVVDARRSPSASAAPRGTTRCRGGARRRSRARQRSLRRVLRRRRPLGAGQARRPTRRVGEDPGRPVELHVFDVVRRGRAGRGGAGALPAGAADPGCAHRVVVTERGAGRRLVGAGRDRSRARGRGLPRRDGRRLGSLDPPRALGAGRARFEAVVRIPRLANSQQLTLVRPAPDGGGHLGGQGPLRR